MNNERLHYIDVFKGLLIVLVIIHHVPYVLGNAIPEAHIIGIRWIQNYIIGFSMPAFFVATGRCANFQLPYLQYLWRNVKTILIPCFCLYYFNHWLTCINAICFFDAKWVTWSHFFSPGIRTFLHEGGFYWFLIALFLSKIIYYHIFVICNHFRYRLITSLLFSIIGVVSAESWPELNYFFWQHALALVVFLPIGESMRRHSDLITKWGGYFLTAYLLVVALFTLLQHHIPSVTRTVDVITFTHPLYIFLSLIGSLGLWYLSELINHNILLEYWGKNTIVIYAFNYIISTIVANALLLFTHPISPLSVFLLFIAIILTDLIFLSFLSWLFNRKLLRLTLGRY